MLLEEKFCSLTTFVHGIFVSYEKVENHIDNRHYLNDSPPVLYVQRFSKEKAEVIEPMEVHRNFQCVFYAKKNLYE